MERRPGVFAFAHLTFQEYLAARALHEGNRADVDVDRVANEHNDGRWKEVIALYCGLAPAPASRQMIEKLIAIARPEFLYGLLNEAYFSTETELAQDSSLRLLVIRGIALAPAPGIWNFTLDRFPPEEVGPIANSLVGTATDASGRSLAHEWLRNHPSYLNEPLLLERIREWRELHPTAIGELVHILHMHGCDGSIRELARMPYLYSLQDLIRWEGELRYDSQAEVALHGLDERVRLVKGPLPDGCELAFVKILHALFNQRSWFCFGQAVGRILRVLSTSQPPADSELRNECIHLARKLAAEFEIDFPQESQIVNKYADSLERVTLITKTGS